MRLRRAIDNAVGSRAFGAAISSGEGSQRKVGFRVGCSIHNKLRFWRRRSRARVMQINPRNGPTFLKYFLLGKAIHPPGERKSEKKGLGGTEAVQGQLRIEQRLSR